MNIKLFRLIHPDIGIPFAHFVSGTSRYYTDQIKLFDHSDFIEFAKNRFDEGYDNVIIGGPPINKSVYKSDRGMYIKPNVIFTSRGCNYHCDYCLVPLWEGSFRPVSFEEVKNPVEKYKADNNPGADGDSAFGDSSPEFVEMPQ